MVRIAVVDDDRDFTDLVRELFQDRGWEVAVCHRENEVMACLREKRPDLILLDIRMEAMDSGWRLLDQLQLDPRFSDIPVVVCSAASTDLEERELWLRGRNIRTLPKPFDIDDLYQAVQASISGREWQISSSAGE